jgi:tetratricopeptide (TPR) repeat protein
MDAKSVQASFQLGLLYARQKEYTKAIEAYVQAADLDPKFPDAVFNLAHVYAMTSEYQKAAEMYAWVVTLEPPYVDEALYNLAIVQEKQGKRQDAIQSLERAIRVNPNNKPAERFLSSLKRKR